MNYLDTPLKNELLWTGFDRLHTAIPSITLICAISHESDMSITTIES